jgi:hypothetical protein
LKKAIKWISKAWDQMDEELIKKSFDCTGISSSNYEDFHKTLKLVLESQQAPETVLVNQEPGDELIYSEDEEDSDYQDSEGDDDDEGDLEDEDEEDEDEDGDDVDDHEDEEDEDEDGDDVDDHEDEEDEEDKGEEKEETDAGDDQESEEEIDNDALENESESDHELPPLYPYIYVPKSSKFKSEKMFKELIFISLHIIRKKNFR